MFDTMLGFGDQLFTGILLVICAGISAHIMHGYGTRKARDTFVGLVLLLAVSVQMFHLVKASVSSTTSKFYTFDVSMK